MTKEEIISLIHKENLEQDILQYLADWNAKYIKILQHELADLKSTKRIIKKLVNTESGIIYKTNGDAIRALLEEGD